MYDTYIINQKFDLISFSILQYKKTNHVKNVENIFFCTRIITKWCMLMYVQYVVYVQYVSA